ncbi:MAG: ATP-binding cassette domain-containing protein [Actinobacteria bacterium]|nr:ATP-binding cassette domain-containing protein [Actinomycetota bacterium]
MPLSSSADEGRVTEEGVVDPLLRVRGVSKAFSGVPALTNVDLDLYGGRVHALLGQNGAGKSTLISIISGVLQPDAGTLEIEGRGVHFRDPSEALASGIVAVYQELSLLSDMTVAENLYLGIEPRKNGLLDRKAMAEGAREILSRLGAGGISPLATVGDLTIASQQMIEVGKALTREAKVLILDEPSAVLGDDELELLYALVGRLTEAGISVVYITHRLDEVMEIADEATVMRDGSVVLALPRGELTHDVMIEAMVGRSVERNTPPKWQSADHAHEEDGHGGLVVSNLMLPGMNETGVNFSLRPGEILGVAGLTGSGRSRLLRALAGVDPPISGSVTWGGGPISIRSPRAAIANGVVLVPEDRKRQGLILGQSVESNIVLSVLGRIATVGWLRSSNVGAIAQDMVLRLQIKTANLGQKVQFLSGGNQQKVVIARCLTLSPRLLLLDEPLRGVDVGAKAEIVDIVGEIASRGTSVIVVSSEIEDVLALTDRIMVMRDGIVAAEFRGAEATEARIFHASAVQGK